MKARGYDHRNVVFLTYHNKDEDISKKKSNQNKTSFSLSAQEMISLLLTNSAFSNLIYQHNS